MIRSAASRRSRIQLIVLAAALALAAVGLTQCRSVSDSVTGVELNTPHTLSVRNSCARKCNTIFKAALMAEERRFLEAKRACGHDYGCKKEEDLKHYRILQQLIHDRIRCKRTCYNEGSGTAGA